MKVHIVEVTSSTYTALSDLVHLEYGIVQSSVITFSPIGLSFIYHLASVKRLGGTVMHEMSHLPLRSWK